MSAWPHVTREHPCPICGKPDYCQFGDRAVKCMRISSEQVCASGGWYHFTKALADIPKRKEEPRKTIDAASMMRRWRASTKVFQFCAVANSLGVLADSIVGIGAGYAPEYKAWAFPMKDGFGETIGIRLRYENGDKRAVTGSRQGIFIPDPAVKLQPLVFLPEGPTDLAALLSMGLYAIARPTCLGGNVEIKAALKRLGIYKAVIVCDNDEIKVGGKRPGLVGALKLKAELGLSSVIWIPPTKDARKFLQAGGTAKTIMQDVNNKIWTRK